MSEEVRYFYADGEEVEPGRLIRRPRSMRASRAVACHRCAGKGQSSAWNKTGRVCWNCHGKPLPDREERAYTAAENAARATAAEEKTKAEAGERSRAIAAARAEFFGKYPDFKDRLARAVKITPAPWLRDILTTLETESLWPPARDTMRSALPAVAEILARAEAAKQKRHLGKVGERIRMRLKTVFQKQIPSNFGVRFFILMNDAEGNAVSHTGSGNSIPGPGEEFEIIATIDAHDTHEGAPVTRIKNPRAAS